MAPKNLVKELIEALSDDTVASAIGTIFERKLQEIMTAVRELKAENDRQTVQITHLQTNPVPPTRKLRHWRPTLGHRTSLSVAYQSVRTVARSSPPVTVTAPITTAMLNNKFSKCSTIS